MLVLGLVMALPATISGLLDYAALPPESPAEGTATAHLVAALTGTVLVGGALLLRVRDAGAGADPSAPAVALSAAAALTLGVAGWLGAELTF